MFVIDPGPEEVVHDFMTGSAIWDDSGLELVTWIFTEQAQSTARVLGVCIHSYSDPVGPQLVLG